MGTTVGDLKLVMCIQGASEFRSLVFDKKAAWCKNGKISSYVSSPLGLGCVCAGFS